MVRSLLLAAQATLAKGDGEAAPTGGFGSTSVQGEPPDDGQLTTETVVLMAVPADSTAQNWFVS